jgi:hypothetical protein
MRFRGTLVPVLSYNDLIGAPGWDYTYGAVGLDRNGDVFEVYSRSSSSAAPGTAVLATGYDVVLQPAVAGTTSCSSGQSPPCDDRWGDYLGTAIDPSDPNSVWVSGLYQVSDGPYGWGTIIAKVSMFGPDDTGRIPSDAPKGPVTKCENNVGKAVDKLVGSLLKCHCIEGSKTGQSDATEEPCETKALAKFTATKTAGCPACINLAAIAATVEGLIDSNNNVVWCDATGTPFGGMTPASSPTSAPRRAGPKRSACVVSARGSASW